MARRKRITTRFMLLKTDNFGDPYKSKAKDPAIRRHQHNMERKERNERSKRRTEILKDTPKTEAAYAAMVQAHPDLWTGVVVSHEWPTGGGISGLGYFVETKALRTINSDGTIVDHTKEEVTA